MVNPIAPIEQLDLELYRVRDIRDRYPAKSPQYAQVNWSVYEVINLKRECRGQLPLPYHRSTAY